MAVSVRILIQFTGDQAVIHREVLISHQLNDFHPVKDLVAPKRVSLHPNVHTTIHPKFYVILVIFNTI